MGMRTMYWRAVILISSILLIMMLLKWGNILTFKTTNENNDTLAHDQIHNLSLKLKK
jgi:hypothetical protein